MSSTPNGLRLFPLFTTHLFPPIALTTYLLSFLPRPLLTPIVSLLSKQSGPSAHITSSLVASPGTVLAALGMARDEMRQVKALDNELVREFSGRCWWYWADGDDDGWVRQSSIREIEEVLDQVGAGAGRERRFRCTEGMQHAFVLNEGEWCFLLLFFVSCLFFSAAEGGREADTFPRGCVAQSTRPHWRNDAQVGSWRSTACNPPPPPSSSSPGLASSRSPASPSRRVHPRRQRPRRRLARARTAQAAGPCLFGSTAPLSLSRSLQPFSLALGPPEVAVGGTLEDDARGESRPSPNPEGVEWSLDAPEVTCGSWESPFEACFEHLKSVS